VYVMATLAPSAARRFAIPAPMPRDPPVISAILPSSFLDIPFLPFISRSLFARRAFDAARAASDDGRMYLPNRGIFAAPGGRNMFGLAEQGGDGSDKTNSDVKRPRL
jgi:hypothetical protein